MTLTIEVEPEEMQGLAQEAAALGEPVQVVARQWFRRGAARYAAGKEARSESTAARLAAIEALPTCDNRRGWPELDLSGERADVYGYSEREALQR